MNSVVLKMASGILKPIFLIVSVWLLLRGHNYPGGGFIGGLIAGSALLFKPLAFDMKMLTEKDQKPGLRFFPLVMIVLLISAITGLTKSNTLLDSQWLKLTLPFLSESLKLGTPLLFDLGVYFIVIGFIHLVFILLMEEWQWK